MLEAMLARLLPPNLAHKAALTAMSVMPRNARSPTFANLRVGAAGLNFPNPLGLAAGFDKDCKVADRAPFLGFGFAEVGTVTPLPQEANPGITMRRFYDKRAVYNRLGFPGRGAKFVAAALKRIRTSSGENRPIIGANISCNRHRVDKMTDYRRAAAELRDADYLTVNVSSPNTEGLRQLQSPDALIKLAKAVKDEFGGAVFVKLSPDESGRGRQLAEAVLTSAFDGVVLTNTSMELAESFTGKREGGISGAPLLPLGLAAARTFASELRGQKVIIGCGGISNGDEAMAYIKSGAHLLQLYSAMVFDGLFAPLKIFRQLAKLCKGRELSSFNPYPLIAPKNAK